MDSPQNPGSEGSDAVERPLIDDYWLIREVQARRNLGFVHNKLVVFASIPPFETPAESLTAG